MRYSFRSDRSGFTLIELIIVLAVISIVAVIGIPSFVGYIQHSADNTCRVTAEHLLTETERSIAARQFIGDSDVEEYFISLIDQISTTELLIASSEELSSMSYRDINGERYTVFWDIKDCYMLVSLICTEHDNKYTRTIRIFYIDTTS